MIDAALARRIKLVGIDVDGVLTDGGIYLGDVAGSRVELKRYDIQDGMGIEMLRMAGILIALVTGRVSESVRLRAAELRADDVAQDTGARKLPAFLAILERRGVLPIDCAFIGDDLPDLAILREVGLPVAVANAAAEVGAACAVRLVRGGGYGAVREFAEQLLRARGQWDSLVERWVREHSASLVEAP